MDLSFLNNPGRGEETVNGLLRITNFDIFSEFFNAHVNPYDPTRKPYNENKSAEKERIILDCILSERQPNWYILYANWHLESVPERSWWTNTSNLFLKISGKLQKC